MTEAGLILEGGGMKGIYTAGVLDYFMDKELWFSDCYGVSMGACNLCSYIALQRGRTAAVTVDYLKDPNYCGLLPLLTTGDLFNAKMAYEDVPLRLNPLDLEAAKRYPGKAWAVVTRVDTGKAEYIPMNDLKESMIYVRASASMPLVSKMVMIDGKPYLDGGIADCIPIMKSLHSGNKKNVVIMTKESGYVRKPFSMMPAVRLMYRKYPATVHALKVRHIRYNKVVAFLEKEHERGNIFLIRPSRDTGVKRVEKDEDKLMELYNLGLEDAAACFEDMKRYLES